MKRINLNPLALDRETIAKLDEKQLQEIIGGATEPVSGTSGDCSTGQSDCSGGTSGDCSTGGSKCFV